MYVTDPLDATGSTVRIADAWLRFGHSHVRDRARGPVRDPPHGPSRERLVEVITGLALAVDGGMVVLG
jgi:hypothetical protein